MKKFKRLEKTLHFLVVLTEEDLARPMSFAKREINDPDFETFREFRHDVLKLSFVYLALKQGRMQSGPGLYYMRVRIPFPSRYYYTKVKRVV